MKRILILLLVMVAILSGCVTAQYHVKINRDGSLDLDYKMAIDKSTLALFGDQDPIKEAKSNAEKEGFDVYDYSEENMTGFKAAKHIEKIENSSFEGLFAEMGATDDKKESLVVKKGLFTDNYKIDANIDLSAMKATGENAEMTNAMISQIKLALLLTLPVKPKQHNAGNVTDDGKTMEWTLVPGDENLIQVEAVIPNILNISIASVAVLVILLLILSYVIRKKRNRQTQETVFSDEDAEQNNTQEDTLEKVYEHMQKIPEEVQNIVADVTEQEAKDIDQKTANEEDQDKSINEETEEAQEEIQKETEEKTQEESSI